MLFRSLYLCLCISAHMSPSGADLKGGFPGFLLLIALIFIVNFAVALAGGSAAASLQTGLRVLSPLLALLLVALALGTLTLLIVVAVTALLPRRSPQAAA